MTKVPRIRVDSKHPGFFINNFWSVITLLENKDQVASFFKDLLTHTEMEMFAKRIQIAKMLMEGYDYRAIRNYARVSDAAIATINNKLQIDGEWIKSAIMYFKQVENTIEKERLKIVPDLKKQYSSYFLLDKVAGQISKKAKRIKRRNSAKQDI